MKGILFFGLQFFEGKTLGNAVDLSKRLAKDGIPCYFLDPFPDFSIKSFFNFFFNRKINTYTIENVTVLRANYFSCLSPSLKIYNYPWLHRLVTKAIWKPVFNVIRNNDLEIIIDNEFLKSFYLPDLFQWPTNYYMRDYLQGVDYWAKIAKKFEPQLIKKCTRVLTNSPYYSGICMEIRKNNVHYIGQGVDLEGLLSVEPKQPEEYKELQQTIVLYVGLLSGRRLDIPLLEAQCSQLPFDFVFIGPEETDFKNSSLHDINNVHFLGPKAFEQLPHYIQFANICFNPQQLNPITIGNYPRKIDEYMAFGKPVVNLKTEGIKMFDPLIFTYSTSNNFGEALALALEKSDDNTFIQQSKQLAQNHSWKNGIDALLNAIEYER